MSTGKKGNFWGQAFWGYKVVILLKNYHKEKNMKKVVIVFITWITVCFSLWGEKIKTFPLYFIPNKGQASSPARFYAKNALYTLWLTKEGLVFEGLRKSRVKHDVTRLLFLDANKDPEMVPVGLTGHRVNYFIGNDPSKWKRGIPTSTAVLYKNLYPHIDLKVYGKGQQVEYDWIVKPGGNPVDIRFRYRHVKSAAVDGEGNLVIHTPFSRLVHRKPRAFQEFPGESPGSRQVEAGFKKWGKNIYGFHVGPYDPSRELVIDPLVLVHSTYLGGSAAEFGLCMTVDSSGCIYFSGYTLSTDYPTLNAFQEGKSPGCDTYVSKLSADGSQLIYSTYLGGNSSDFGDDIAVDSSGRAYLVGEVLSTDFPVKNAFQDTRYGFCDGYITCLSADGGDLEFSTFLGGSDNDVVYSIAIDNNGDIYLSGGTSSFDFPGAPYPHKIRPYDVFVAKMPHDASGFIYCKAWGGSRHDSGYAIALDPTGCAYVAGVTTSPDFPTVNPIIVLADDSNKGFITKLSADGSEIVYSTYIGGTVGGLTGIPDDGCYGLAVDSSGHAYVTGFANARDFPVTNNAFQGELQGEDAFVAKLSLDGGSFVYCTYLGGSYWEIGQEIGVNSSGNVAVTGYTSSFDFPVKEAYQDHFGGGTVDDYDLFLTMLSPDGSELIYSTYFGGSDWDLVQSLHLDDNGNAYVVGRTYSSDFPTMNAYQPQLAGGSSCDVFISRFFYTTQTTTTFMSLSRERFYFGAAGEDRVTGPQSFWLRYDGPAVSNWTVTSDSNWLQAAASSGTGEALIDVSVVPPIPAPGSYTGTLTVSDASAANSPQTVTVTLTVTNPWQDNSPFGTFETPGDSSTVSGSVPFTGWVLDDIQVDSVKIYREEGAELIYVGDALLVENARPDVETANPTVPNSHKAGWGYLMLTNALPGEGNGTCTFHAAAADTAGNRSTLGIKTVTCNNASSVNPFGSIDAPLPGETVYGSNYRHLGWVLTPLPDTIATDGSTITVYIDGAAQGSVVYNQARPDVAALFPGYHNSSGPGSYMYIDTTQFTNGSHTIALAVSDSSGDSAGIGSRYFTVNNTGSTGSRQTINASAVGPVNGLKVDPLPVFVKKGFGTAGKPQRHYPPKDGTGVVIHISELERLVVYLTGTPPLKEAGEKSRVCSGYHCIGDSLHPLPVGSYLNSEKGIFYWHPGPGFLGIHRLTFVIEKNTRRLKKDIIIRIIRKR